MKKQFLLLLLSLSLSFANSQTVTHVYVDVEITGGGIISYPNPGQGVTTICKGTVLTLSTFMGCTCGYSWWINTKYDFCAGGCTFTPVTNQTFQGANIIEHSTPPAITSCEPPLSESYRPVCKVAPDQTTTYSIAWEKTFTETCLNRSTIFHYSGTLLVNVIAPKTPIITAYRTTTALGESIIIRSDCNFQY
jgi:hypothetical protein